MTKSEPAAGRQHLAALLRAAGSVYDPPGLEALLRGVLGAPAEMGGGWHRLVADPMPPPLAAALDNFYAERRAPGRAARRVGRARPRRVCRAALGRTSGRICAAARPAAGLADRLYRLGRGGGGAAPTCRPVCRRPLYPAGGAAG